MMALPALVLLVMMVPLRVSVPYADSWSFIGQHQMWVEGNFGWRNFFHKSGDHPCAVGKALYLAILHWLHGNVGLLPFVGWALSAVVAVCVIFLSRPLWRGNLAKGTVLMFCAGLTIFSASHGGMWTWDYAFQNYIPGACLAAGILVLSDGPLTRRRIIIAATLSVIATFSLGSGFLVGGLLSLLFWQRMGDIGTAKKAALCGAWLAFMGLVAGIAIKGFGPETQPPGIDVLFDRPLMRLHFAMILLGQMLGSGTVFETLRLSALFGILLSAVFVVCMIVIFRHRRERSWVTLTVPWLVFSFYGLANAALICAGRMGDSDDSFAAFTHKYALAERADAERFITYTLFFVLGIVFLVAAVMQHDGEPGVVQRWTKGAAAPAITIFIAAHLLNWKAGYHVMKLEEKIMKQERALLTFGGFVPPDPDHLWNSHTRNRTYGLARELSEQGRLPSVRFAPDAGLDSFQHSDAYTNRAGFNQPVQLEDGSWKLAGFCGLSNRDDSDLPELVLITAEVKPNSERIVAVAPPSLPETFLERRTQRRKYPEHFGGWSQTLEAAAMPEGLVTLRTYGFYHDAWQIRPIPGTHKLDIRAR
jgi:hypothetical protein